MNWIGVGREFEGSLAAGDLRGDPGPRSALQVTVIFTRVAGTTAALQAAGTLAHGLGAKLTLLVPHVVPYQFPLTRPPVDLDHARRAALALLSGLCPNEHDMTIQICLCRSPQECWNRAVPAGSLVLVGGRRWWARSERRLAERIRSLGHQVIFVSQKGRRHA